jgi:hypothetical protein
MDHLLLSVTDLSPWTFGWDALVACGTLALAAVTVVLAFVTREGVRAASDSARDARAANQLPAVMELLKEYRSPEMRQARVTVLQGLRQCDPTKGLEQLNVGQREAVEMVSHFLDNLGVLVAFDMLKPEPAAAFLGGSTLAIWRTAGPFIEAERRVNDRATYQRYFEHLAGIFEGIDYEAEIDLLNVLAPSLVSETPADG